MTYASPEARPAMSHVSAREITTAIRLHAGVVLEPEGRPHWWRLDDAATGESAKIETVSAVVGTACVALQHIGGPSRLTRECANGLVASGVAYPVTPDAARELGFRATVARARRQVSTSQSWVRLTMVCVAAVWRFRWRTLTALTVVFVALAAGFRLHGGAVAAAVTAMPLTVLCIAAHEAGHWAQLRRVSPSAGALFQISSRICVLRPHDLSVRSTRLVAASGAAGGLLALVPVLGLALLVGELSLVALCVVLVLVQLAAVTPLTSDGRELWADSVTSSSEAL